MRNILCRILGHKLEYVPPIPMASIKYNPETKKITRIVVYCARCALGVSVGTWDNIYIKGIEIK